MLPGGYSCYRPCVMHGVYKEVLNGNKLYFPTIWKNNLFLLFSFKLHIYFNSKHYDFLCIKRILSSISQHDKSCVRFNINISHCYLCNKKQGTGVSKYWLGVGTSTTSVNTPAIWRHIRINNREKYNAAGNRNPHKWESAACKIMV